MAPRQILVGLAVLACLLMPVAPQHHSLRGLAPETGSAADAVAPTAAEGPGAAVPGAGGAAAPAVPAADTPPAAPAAGAGADPPAGADTPKTTAQPVVVTNPRVDNTQGPTAQPSASEPTSPPAPPPDQQPSDGTTNDSANPTEVTSSSGGGGSDTAVIAGVTVGIILAVAALSAAYFVWRQRKRRAAAAAAAGCKSAMGAFKGLGFTREPWGGATRYCLVNSGRPVTWAAALDMLQNMADTTVADQLAAEMRAYAHDHPAFFWECAPIAHSLLDEKEFEFVLNPARGLDSLQADPVPFRKFLAAGDGTPTVATFHNLNRDAVLVAPCRALDSARPYAHLASFVCDAPATQVRELWRAVAAAANSQLRREPAAPLWVSTSGLGVSWLHVRLDTRPKYYTHAPYRQPPQLALKAGVSMRAMGEAAVVTHGDATGASAHSSGAYIVASPYRGATAYRGESPYRGVSPYAAASPPMAVAHQV